METKTNSDIIYKVALYLGFPNVTIADGTVLIVQVA